MDDYFATRRAAMARALMLIPMNFMVLKSGGVVQRKVFVVLGIRSPKLKGYNKGVDILLTDTVQGPGPFGVQRGLYNIQ